MEITGRNKLIVRENGNSFESELNLDLKHETTENRTVKLFGLFEERNTLVKIGYVSCKGTVVSKTVEFSHEESIVNVKRVFAETLEQAFRGSGENSTLLKSQVTYSYGILKSEVPQLVTIHLILTTENKLEFEVVTSANSYEECNLNARKLLKEFIGELQSQIESEKK